MCCPRETLDADYWWRNIRAPVAFEPAVRQAITAHEIDVFVGAWPASGAARLRSADRQDHRPHRHRRPPDAAPPERHDASTRDRNPHQRRLRHPCSRRRGARNGSTPARPARCACPHTPGTASCTGAAAGICRMPTPPPSAITYCSATAPRRRKGCGPTRCRPCTRAICSTTSCRVRRSSLRPAIWS